MTKSKIARAFQLLLLAGTASPAITQTPLDLAGGSFFYNGTFQDTTVPDLKGTIFNFAVLGADGGEAITGGGGQCFNAGGQGATATFHLTVGSGAGLIAPGTTLRAIVGEAGGSSTRAQQNARAGGGGGGGTGLLTKAPGADSFTNLAVAGGGGGAASRAEANVCNRPNEEGKNAETGINGGMGNNGGEGGTNGSVGIEVVDASGSGGGFILTTRSSSAGGRTGIQFAGPVGGRGGTGHANGGFGYGGGGASVGITPGGGGGGGYSGGGSGNSARAGGGGGSFIDGTRTSNASIIRTSAGFIDGIISYAVAGQAHDSRDKALVLTSAQTSIKGSTRGATSTGFDTCGNPATVPDVWYTYTNNTNEAQAIQVDAVTGVNALALVDGFDNCLFNNASSINLVLPPTGFVDIGVASNASTFEVSLSIETDTDSDGFGDSVDVCPGVDDSTLTPEQLAADIDNDGIVDLCDKACPADLRADGIWDVLDVNTLFFVLFFTQDDPAQRVPALDFDSSGEFDFFDLAIFIEGCP